MLDPASIISICSALGSAGIVVYTTVIASKTNIQNLKDSLAEFKCEIKSEIVKEKRHAMELAGERIGTITKDVDEIFPRLRKVEADTQKNCYALSAMQKNCIKHQGG